MVTPGRILTLIFLASVVLLQAGCATETKAPSDDNTSVLEPVPSQDDSHGWGANIRNTSH